MVSIASYPAIESVVLNVININTCASVCSTNVYCDGFYVSDNKCNQIIGLHLGTHSTTSRDVYIGKF